jgi:ParB family transcriptional regulator, chromosome partitioning protein
MADHEDEPVTVEPVIVEGRHRKDLGDLVDLATSIHERGLLQPIVVTTELRLVAGERRLAAVRELGDAEIDAVVIESLTDATSLLLMERDENTCRKPMTPEELYDLGQALEAIERPKAHERQGTRTDLHQPGDRPDTMLAPQGKTRDIVAPALGLSATQYDRVKSIRSKTGGGLGRRTARCER